MALINTAIKPFKANAFKDGEFVEVSSEDIKGKWAVFVFYPADFTFVCPTELGDVADKYEEQGKKLHIRHISDECRSLLRKADKFVEINVVEDPRYRVATDKLA